MRLLLCAGALCLGLALALAQESPFTPYQHRALYLYNFAKFTKWPEQVFAEAGAPLVLGILGEDHFGKDAEILNGKAVRGHPLVVRRLGSLAEINSCHLLFISDSEKGRMREVLAALKGRSLLTVAEMRGFVEAGGMINLDLEKKNLVFDINQAAAEAAGLKLDSRLLRLARSVETKRAESE